MKPTIKVLDQQILAGRIFRVARMVGGSCQIDLACRLEIQREPRKASGHIFVLTFYDYLHHAEHGEKPLIAIPIDRGDLVAEAFKVAEKLADEWFDKERIQ